MAKTWTAVVTPEKKDQYETGAHRGSSDGKPRFDLIPTMPHRRLAMHFANGAKVYGDDNWQKGLPLRRYIESLERHMNALRAGDTTEDHAAAVLWNMYCYMWTEEEIAAGRLPASLDNRAKVEPQYDRRRGKRKK